MCFGFGCGCFLIVFSFQGFVFGVALCIGVVAEEKFVCQNLKGLEK